MFFYNTKDFSIQLYAFQRQSILKASMPVGGATMFLVPYFLSHNASFPQHGQIPLQVLSLFHEVKIEVVLLKFRDPLTDPLVCFPET